MGEKATPRVSIGLPVYNGETFLVEAIESILAQTFEDFELIISDNASTDGTKEICHTFAGKDKRVRYVRNVENIGLSRNYTQVFALSSGEYFKWAAHDDVCRPTFLARCVQALDCQHFAVMAYPKGLTIDSTGQTRKIWEPRPELASPRVDLRLRRALLPEESIPLCGLIRAEVLRGTRLLGRYPESDLILLSELTLRGPCIEIPEALFLLREHPQRSVRTHDWRNPDTMLTWLDPTNRKSVNLPEWGLLADLVSAVRRAPLGWPKRWSCYREVYRWLKPRKNRLMRDVALVAGRLPGIGTVITSSYQKYLEISWDYRLRRSTKDVVSVIPSSDMFILVDEANFPADIFHGRRTTPFLERDGQYWGAPPDDQTAIRECERLRRSGASFMVFTWPAFWWLGFYSELNRYLRSRFRCVMENDRLVIFDLRHGSDRTNQ